MANWILIAAAKSLFAAFNELAPDRDRTSDGSIGDAAHQNEVSDHNPDETGSVPIHDADHINEVHAIDVDNNLNVPGLSMEEVVQFILNRCRTGAEQRLRYIIYNRRIWEADNGWKQRVYTGTSAHTEHVHFSFSYVTALEANTSSWHLEELDMTPAQLQTILDAINAPYIDTDPGPGSETRVGHATGVQEWPDYTQEGTPQVPQYIAFGNLAKVVMDIKAAVVAIENHLEGV